MIYRINITAPSYLFSIPLAESPLGVKPLTKYMLDETVIVTELLATQLSTDTTLVYKRGVVGVRNNLFNYIP